MKSKIITPVIIILLVLPFINAYELLCLSYGQSVPSDENPRKTCYHDTCIICVTDNYYPTHLGYCRDIESCTLFGNPSLDVTPPDLTINLPNNDDVYNSRKVLFDLETDEPASFYYVDNTARRPRWKRLTSNTQSYYKTVRLNEGFNDITIKAVDRHNNEIEYIRQFYVDSKKPKIKRTEPRKGFSDGHFEVQFSEENPAFLTLYYGNQATGERNADVDIGECVFEKKRYYCEIDVNLEAYDGEDIDYWFKIEDIAESTHKSKPITLSVDTTAPVINNHETMYYVDGKYVYFNIDIDELNFDEVSYYDYSDRRPKWKKLCSRLRDGICEKKKSFNRGFHVLDLQITDEAGNAISERIEFNIDY